MTSGTIKGKKISVIFARFEACSSLTSGWDNIEHSLIMTRTFALQALKPFAFSDWITSLMFWQFQESFLRQNKTVERWVTLLGFSSWSASFLADPLLFTSNRSDTLALDFKYSVASSLQCQICYRLIHFPLRFCRSFHRRRKGERWKISTRFVALFLRTKPDKR